MDEPGAGWRIAGKGLQGIRVGAAVPTRVRSFTHPSNLRTPHAAATLRSPPPVEHKARAVKQSHRGRAPPAGRTAQRRSHSAGSRDRGQERCRTCGHSPSEPRSNRGTVGDTRRTLIRAGTLLPESQRAALAPAADASLSHSPQPSLSLTPGKKKRKKKKKSRATVAGKSLLSHLPTPLSLPSPRQVRTRQPRQPGPAAQTLSACSAAGCRVGS